MRDRLHTPLRRSPDFQAVFHHAPVALVEMDVEGLRRRIGEKRKPGHAVPVEEARSLIEVTAANAAALRLLKADVPAEFPDPLSRFAGAIPATFVEGIIRALREGGRDLELEWTAVTLKGGPVSAVARARVPAADDSFPRMVVSLLDAGVRKPAEENGIPSSDIVQCLFESFPAAVLLKDASRRLVLCNRLYSAALGKEPNELYGKTDAENGWSAGLIEGNPESGIARWEQNDRAALAGKTVNVGAIPVRRGDGTGYIDMTLMPVRVEGSVVGMLGIGHDVTAHWRMEKDLAWERSLLTMLMEYLPDYIYFKDRESRFIRTSKSHARALGLNDPSEAVGRTDADFYRADYARKAMEDDLTALSGVPVVDIEERESYPNRPDTWGITTKMPLRNAQGDIIGTFGITHDITPRKQLEERNRQLAALVHFADDAVIGIGTDSRVTVWNSGAERIYGYTAEEMIGASTSLLTPPELVEEARTITATILGGRQISHFETVRLRKDGTRIIVSASLSAIRDDEGRVVGMATTARDITAQKEIETQLNRAQRLESLATLAGGIAHQFNNINTVVIGYHDLLQAEKSLSAQSASYLAAASAALQKSVDITDRLLALTQRPDMDSKGVRLDTLTHEVLGELGSRLMAGRVRLVQDVAEVPAIPGDPSRLHFVIASLIANALDSLLDRPSPMIRVRTGSSAESIFFEVEDSGCGIPDADLPRIFSPFFSAKGEWAPPFSPQARLRGVGLSLAISNMTVSEYGGRIEVRSVKDVGSTFRVVFPAVKRGP